MPARSRLLFVILQVIFFRDGGESVSKCCSNGDVTAKFGRRVLISMLVREDHTANQPRSRRGEQGTQNIPRSGIAAESWRSCFEVSGAGDIGRR